MCKLCLSVCLSVPCWRLCYFCILFAFFLLSVVALFASRVVAAVAVALLLLRVAVASVVTGWVRTGAAARPSPTHIWGGLSLS